MVLLLLQVAFACGSQLNGICRKLKSSTGGTQSTWIASYGNFDLLDRFPASNLGLEAIQCFKKTDLAPNPFKFKFKWRVHDGLTIHGFMKNGDAGPGPWHWRRPHEL